MMGCICWLSDVQLQLFFVSFFFFFFKQKTAYEMQRGLVGSEMCIRDRYMGEWVQYGNINLLKDALSLIHISEPTRPLYISYAVFCLKKKKKKLTKNNYNYTSLNQQIQPIIYNLTTGEITKRALHNTK
eukprot:TRINITY_DN9051_c0_g1_i7.p1 TRINITY_DN9051_c0_g1~~TRINITY_DN9051_c0_g1_i7.p1  ORF type:complete len:129 (+),score=31.14 TRINITY_DN9051_c0_g1_i7:81-467(+)